MSTAVPIPQEIQQELDRLRGENLNLQKELNKFGLRFKTYPEQGDAQRILRGEIPFLKFNAENSVIKDDKTESDVPHLLIEGDNLPALMALQSTHQGAVDVIYIDPPYNTGNKDFIYNDSFVSDDDGFRHSKWLSFMKPRLTLAKNLLSDEGVIFVSIDDNEQAALKLLVDEIFGEKNMLTSIIWQKKSGGGQAKYAYEGHEYIFAYAKNKNKVESLTEKDTDVGRYPTVEIDGKVWGVNDDFLRKKHGKYEAGTERRLHYEDILAVKGERKLQEIEQGILSGEYILTDSRTEPGKHYVAKLYDLEAKRKLLYSIVQRLFTAVGSNELEKVLGRNVFDNPKPIGLIKKIVDLLNRDNAVVLDFFAGSGTTAHAVAELNKEDGGNRQCILVTHGEEKGKSIAQDITAERMKRVLTGENWADGKAHDPLPGELYYYQVEFSDGESGEDYIGIVSIMEEAYSVIEQGVDDTVIVLEGKDNLIAVWTDSEQLESYDDMDDEGNLMSEVRIQKMNDWFTSRGENVVWYVDTAVYNIDYIPEEELFEEGETVKAVYSLKGSYLNRVVNTRNLLDTMLVKEEEPAPED